MNKPFSQACENNKQPILEVIEVIFENKHHILEIGSGTGQHAVYFSQMLPHLHWHTSDKKQNHDGINIWTTEYPSRNLHKPINLDVSQRNHWNTLGDQKICFDGIFTANTLHIMSWDDVIAMFEALAILLSSQADFVIYGPFNRNGLFTSESNQKFDHSLKSCNEHMGIRNDVDVFELAENNEFIFLQGYEMPANNRILVFKKL